VTGSSSSYVVTFAAGVGNASQLAVSGGSNTAFTQFDGGGSGVSDTIGSLTMVEGPTYSGKIATGTGTLTLGGDFNVKAFQGTRGGKGVTGSGTAAPAATITGNLTLGVGYSGVNSNVAKRIFTVNDSGLAGIATDLDIQAVISGDSSLMLVKQ